MTTSFPFRRIALFLIFLPFFAGCAHVRLGTAQDWNAGAETSASKGDCNAAIAEYSSTIQYIDENPGPESFMGVRVKDNNMLEQGRAYKGRAACKKKQGDVAGARADLAAAEKVSGALERAAVAKAAAAKAALAASAAESAKLEAKYAKEGHPYGSDASACIVAKFGGFRNACNEPVRIHLVTNNVDTKDRFTCVGVSRPYNLEAKGEITAALACHVSIMDAIYIGKNRE